MLKCTKGIKGKKLTMIIKLTNKQVTFKPGLGPSVPLTKEEEDVVLKMKIPGWEIKKESEKKEEKVKGGD